MSKATALLNLLSVECICLDLQAENKQALLAEMVDLLQGAGKLRDREQFLRAIQEREATASTGLEQGVAIPHASSDSVRESSIAFGIARKGLDFGALDGQPSRFFLMIAEPGEGASEHLEILAEACCRLNEAEFRQQLLDAKNAAEVIQLFGSVATREAADTPAKKPEAPENREAASEQPLVLAAVTSCPVGVSHTYMAAERLREAAQRMGIELLVETHGSVGVKGKLNAEDIARSRAVILAVDRKVDDRRFAGKPVVETWVTEAISDPEGLIRKALNAPGAPLLAGPIETDQQPAGDVSGFQLYRHLMYGISTILPFLIAGGILLSIAGITGSGDQAISSSASASVQNWLRMLGGAQGAFGLLVLVLAGFIGRSIAGNIGLMPAMVGGFLMAQAEAGLLGGICAGLLGGYGMVTLERLLRRLPPQLETIKAILLYPLLGLLIGGGLSWLASPGLAFISAGITSWLFGMGLPERIVLGLFLGALMAVDLGGPINKLAFTFGIIAIGMGNYLPTAAVMAAGMAPPLALGLSSMVWPSRFGESERKLGKSCFFKGTCFVTEGVIPFVQANRGRVLPPCIIGAMLTGALSMAFGCELMVPHGGIFVIPLVKHWPQYCMAITCGVLLTSVLVLILRPIPGNQNAQSKEEKPSREDD